MNFKLPAILCLGLGIMAESSTGFGAVANDGVDIVKEMTDSVVCREADGTEITLKKHPQRVVICYGSLVGIWYCAGGRAIAGPDVTSITTLPEAARKLSSVGSFNNPNVEQILLLKPDLVLLVAQQGKHRAVREILNQNHIPSLMVNYENYRDFTHLLELFCRINGASPATVPGAQKIIAEVAAVTTKAKTLSHPRFMTLFTGHGVTVETSSGNASAMAELLGGENIVKESRGTSVKFSMEKVALENPD